MPHATAQKQAQSFALAPNARAATYHFRTSDEIRLHEGVSADYDKWRDENGRHPVRAFARVAGGEGTPYGNAGRQTILAAKVGIPIEWVLAPAYRFIAFVHVVYAKYARRSRAA